MAQDHQSEMEQIIVAYKNKNYILVQNLTLQFIMKNPLTEQAWVLLGDALLHQGYGDMARKVYERARLFNPHANWYTRRLDSLKMAPKGSQINSIEALLKPQNKSSVSAIILTKNEERCIARCLSSVKDAVDEVIVVDTGSTDRTIEICKGFPNTRIIPFPWCDDFSAARNFGMSQSQSNWVLWIDADESLYPDDIHKIKEIASILDHYYPDPLLHIGILNQVADRISIDYSVPRMFPLRGTLRYFGRIHEQIGPATGDRYTMMSTHDFFLNVRVLHDGYDPDKTNLKEKLQRNISLLRRMIDEEPDDPTWLFFLGRELIHYGEINEGIEILLIAEENGKKREGFGSLLAIQKILITSYLNSHNFTKAEEVCHRMIETEPSFPDSYYYLAYIQLHSKADVNQIVENINKVKIKSQQYRGLVSSDSEIMAWKADYLLAETLRLNGHLIEARNYYLTVFNHCPESYKGTIKSQLELIENKLIEPNNY